MSTSNSTIQEKNIAAVVAYDGTEYFGFQYQVNQPTVQRALEEALAKVIKVPRRVTGSGRTDTGVHASGQVVGAQVPWNHSDSALLRAWNAHLPKDIVVRQVCTAPSGFHPRFSARSRTYSYTVYQSNGDGQGRLITRSPLTDRFAFLEQGQLNVAKMQQAGQHLLGEHNFITFGRPPQGNNAVRQVVQVDVQKRADVLHISGPHGTYIVFTITANAFLRQMVRNIVGTLLEVGRNRWEPEDVKSALVACDRSRCAPPAAPQGLVLQNVLYPDYPGMFTGCPAP